jgi:hypothetical protein
MEARWRPAGVQPVCRKLAWLRLAGRGLFEIAQTACNGPSGRPLRNLDKRGPAVAPHQPRLSHSADHEASDRDAGVGRLQ